MSEIIKVEEKQLSTEVEKKLFLYNQAVKEAEIQAKKLKEALYEEMEKREIIKFENDNMVITRILSTTRETIDSKKLKKEYPEIAKMFIKTSNVKGSIRMKFKTDDFVENSIGKIEEEPKIIIHGDQEAF